VRPTRLRRSNNRSAGHKKPEKPQSGSSGISPQTCAFWPGSAVP